MFVICFPKECNEMLFASSIFSSFKILSCFKCYFYNIKLSVVRYFSLLIDARVLGPKNYRFKHVYFTVWKGKSAILIAIMSCANERIFDFKVVTKKRIEQVHVAFWQYTCYMCDDAKVRLKCVLILKFKHQFLCHLNQNCIFRKIMYF